MSRLISAGKYRAKALGGEFGESPEKRTPYVRVEFGITEGPEKGENVAWQSYFTEKTEARTVEGLKLCGCTFPGGEVFDLTGLMSNEVSIVVEHEAFTTKDGERKTVAKVQWVNSGVGGVKEEQKMSPSNAEAFRQRVRGVILASKASASPTANPDADIPF